jgi:hypothetical protein
MRREFKDDLVATVVLALCTLVLLLPARPRHGGTDIQLAAPGAPAIALPPPDGVAGSDEVRPAANGVAGSVKRSTVGGPTSAHRQARPRS